MEYSIGRRKLSFRETNPRFGGEDLAGLRLRVCDAHKQNTHFHEIFKTQSFLYLAKLTDLKAIYFYPCFSSFTD
jgi:hypothetical protein